jgi:PPOX class probable F420-dependent enzyme
MTAGPTDRFIGGEDEMAEGFTIAKFRDVAHGLQAGQFAVGERRKAASLAELDPRDKALLDRPIVMTLGLTGPDGRPSLTPMWFDHEGDKVLVNTASHRSKCAWIRRNPRLTVLLVNPDNPYHWVQIKCTVERELREWEPGGDYVTRQLDRIWTKYTGKAPPYALRDPSIDEKRVLFVCGIDRIATFGEP